MIHLQPSELIEIGKCQLFNWQMSSNNNPRSIHFKTIRATHSVFRYAVNLHILKYRFIYTLEHGGFVFDNSNPA